MSAQTYRIKPLRWWKGSPEEPHASALGFSYDVRKQEDGTWEWFCGDECGNANWGSVPTKKEAKAKCEEHYREMLLEHLEEIKS